MPLIKDQLNIEELPETCCEWFNLQNFEMENCSVLGRYYLKDLES